MYMMTKIPEKNISFYSVTGGLSRATETARVGVEGGGDGRGLDCRLTCLHMYQNRFIFSLFPSIYNS